MKDYTKDPSVPLPLAELLNAAQYKAPPSPREALAHSDTFGPCLQSEKSIDSVGWYALKLGEVLAERDRALAWAQDEQQKREKVEDDRLIERRRNEHLLLDLKAAMHRVECADEQIKARTALFQKIAEIAEELERAARERWLFRDIENREPIINLRRISEIARAASSNASNQLKVSP